MGKVVGKDGGEVLKKRTEGESKETGGRGGEKGPVADVQ